MATPPWPPRLRLCREALASGIAATLATA